MVFYGYFFILEVRIGGFFIWFYGIGFLVDSEGKEFVVVCTVYSRNRGRVFGFFNIFFWSMLFVVIVRFLIL